MPDAPDLHDDADADVTAIARPLRLIPEPSTKPEITKLRNELVKAGLSRTSADAVARACVYPARAGALLANPTKYRIPGGELLAIRVEAYANRVVPDATNPRTLNDVPFPAAIEPGSNDSARYNPVSLPTASETSLNLELVVESIDQLIWQLDATMSTVVRANTPKPAVELQGVMEPPLAVPIDIHLLDSNATVGSLLVREGSSRMSHVHRILGFSARDLLLQNQNDNAHRHFITELNSIANASVTNLSAADAGRLRVAVVPLDIVVGFEPDQGVSMSIADAVAGKVEQDHINHKQQWDPAAKDVHLGEVCLQSLLSSASIGKERYEWLAGRLTKERAALAGLQSYDDDRWIELLWVFTTKRRDVAAAVRRPIFNALDRESRRAAVRNKQDKVPLAVSLAMRARRGRVNAAAIERESRVLSEGVIQDAWQAPWEPSSSTPLQLAEAAINDAKGRRIGPSGIELAMRALWYLAKNGQISMPRNDLGRGGDRRMPSELVKGLLGSVRGVYQLRQIVEDGRDNSISGLVADEKGNLDLNAVGNAVPLDDSAIRTSLVPREGPPPPPPRNHYEEYMDALADLASRVSAARAADSALRQVVDEYDKPLFEQVGVSPDWANNVREVISELVAHISDYEVSGKFRLMQDELNPKSDQ